MNIKPHVVILTTIVFLAAGCETEDLKEPGPLERAASSEQTLTSALAPAPIAAVPKPASEEPKHADTPAAKNLCDAVPGHH